MFQALGNTLPGLIASASRLLTYAVPLFWLTQQPGHKIEHVWYLSVTSMFVALCVASLLLRSQMRTRLATAVTQPA
jgi:Na+-driven multidrug efflux pump